MAYCRWSSMNWMCDVYVYESREGFVTHVGSGRKVIPPVPQLPMWFLVRKGALSDFTARLWFWSHRFNSWTLGLIPSRKIGLQFDGESFTDDTPGECADRLVALRRLGYNVPQYAIDNLRSEAEPESSEGTAGTAEEAAQAPSGPQRS